MRYDEDTLPISMDQIHCTDDQRTVSFAPGSNQTILPANKRAKMSKVNAANFRKAISLVLPSLGKKVRIGNRRYHVHGFTVNHLAYQDAHEPWLNSVLRAALESKAGSFVDIGANTGQTLMKLLALDPDREYVGFEPQTDCCFYISRFIKRNGLVNCKIFPIGLSNTTGVLTLFKRAEAKDLTASIIRGFRPDDFYTNSEFIFVARGEEILTFLSPRGIGTIKIDVEGAELEVLEGLGEILLRQRPIIFFEVLNHYIVVTKQNIDNETIAFRESRIRKVEALFSSMRYCIFHIVPGNSLARIGGISPAISANLEITNYVAVHDDLKDVFLANMEQLGKIPLKC